MSGVADTDGDVFADELKPGTVLMRGQYTIDRFLNSGGFGITYLARDSLDRKIVIKECFPGAFARRTNLLVKARSRAHQGEYSAVVRHFVQEARSLAKLKHPNIVGVHQVFEENETAYMALDFIEGRDLLDTLEDPDHGLTPSDIQNMLKEVLGAIDYMHGENVLHRDISPDNILLDANMSPVLIDFGAARENTSDVGRALSALRVVKEGYSPHEFYLSGSTQSESSDLYALAATFYHLICGEVPPDSQTRLAAIAAKSPDPYVMLSSRTSDFSLAFTSAVDHAMRVLPKNRLQSAKAWLDKINAPQVILSPNDDCDFDSKDDDEDHWTGLEPDAETVIDRSIFDDGPVRPQLSEYFTAENAKGVATDLKVKCLQTISHGKGIPSAWKIRAAVASLAVFGIFYLGQYVDTLTKWSVDEAAVAATPEVQIELYAAPAEIENPIRPEVVAKSIEVADVDEAVVKAEVDVDEPVGVLLASAPIARPVSDTKTTGVALGANDVAQAVQTEQSVASAPVAVLSKSRFVVLPFETAGMFIESGSPDGVFQAGQSIVSINGRKILSDRDVAISLSELVPEPNVSSVEARFEIRDPTRQSIFKEVRLVPIAEAYVLSNGLKLQTIKDGTEWVTTVVKIPKSGGFGDLLVGDILIADLASGKTISDRDTLEKILTEGINTGVHTFKFAIQRGRSMQIAALTSLSAN